MIKQAFLISFLVASALAGCHPSGPNLPKDTANCPTACGHLKDMKCQEGDDLPDGTTCRKFCEDTQNSGHALNPSCALRAKTCDEFRSTCQ